MAAFLPLLLLLLSMFFSFGCCFAVFAGINIRDASIDTLQLHVRPTQHGRCEIRSCEKSRDACLILSPRLYVKLCCRRQQQRQRSRASRRVTKRCGSERAAHRHCPARHKQPTRTPPIIPKQAGAEPPHRRRQATPFPTSPPLPHQEKQRRKAERGKLRGEDLPEEGRQRKRRPSQPFQPTPPQPPAFAREEARPIAQRRKHPRWPSRGASPRPLPRQEARPPLASPSPSLAPPISVPLA